MGEVYVFAIGNFAFVGEGLKVGAVFYPVGRVDVDGLHIAAHALFVEQAVHHQQAVARDQPVAPVVSVPVELDGLAQRRVLVRQLEQRLLARAGVGPAHRLDDAARIDPLMYMKRDGGNLEIVALNLVSPAQLDLARPDQLRVKMRVVGLRAGGRLPKRWRRATTRVEMRVVRFGAAYPGRFRVVRFGATWPGQFWIVRFRAGERRI